MIYQVSKPAYFLERIKRDRNQLFPMFRLVQMKSNIRNTISILHVDASTLIAVQICFDTKHVYPFERLESDHHQAGNISRFIILERKLKYLTTVSPVFAFVSPINNIETKMQAMNWCCQSTSH